MAPVNDTPLVAMRGDGEYSRHSAKQRRTLKQGLKYLTNLPNPSETAQGKPLLSIADYGCSQGLNSTLSLQHILTTQPPTVGARVSLIDTPHTDWTTLSRTLLAHHPSLSSNRHRPLLTSMVPASFFHQCLPDASVDIAVAWSALHFLSRAPAPLPASATPAALLRLFARHSPAVAHRDLVAFLAHRARETRPGGVFVAALLAHDGTPASQAGIRAATVAARREFVAEGRLGGEVGGVLPPAHERSRAEMEEAFGEVAGLWEVEVCVEEEVVHPAYDVLVGELEAGEGEEEEAYRRYARSVATWWMAALGGILTRTGAEREGTLEETADDKRVMEELTERIAKVFFEEYRDDPTRSKNWYLRLRRK